MNKASPSTLPPLDDRGLHAYHILRAAVEIYGKQPGELEASELSTATARAEQARELENLVLRSDNGRRVSIPDVAVDDAIDRIRARYENDNAFKQSLLESGVVESDLRRALWRELAFDAVLSMVSDACEPVTDAEIEAYYENNPRHFNRPELRTVRHILITINDDYAENTREQALKRITDIAEHLAIDPGDFADQARTQSECPTALEGGLLGHAPQGKLYPELDAALFALNEGDIAGPIETEAGFHMILCEKIQPGAVITLDEAREKLREHLTNTRRKAAQKAWIEGLKT